MAEDQAQPPGPDLALGISAAELPDGGKLLGHVGQDPVLLVRRGAEVFAIGAQCTHYSGPLAEGIVVDGAVRCPWHHACFDLRTGEALRAPALSPVDSWRVEERDGKIIVREKRARPEARPRAQPDEPRRIVIVGGGAAGFAAAEMLRRRKYQGGIVMLSSDDAPPVDRPNLSKDYLAGSAPEEWLPLATESFYADNAIDLRLNTTVAASIARAREVALAGGEKLPFDRLLLATGAEPVSPSIPGARPSDVLVLRSLKDFRAIIERAKTAKRVVVLGASFIGLEVAASLSARKIEVHVVAPEERPMERILGPDFSRLVQAIHESHGVVFHLGETASGLEGKRVSLKGGSSIEADFIVAGLGVRPRLSLAEAAGLNIDRGVAVDALSRNQRARNFRRRRYRALARSPHGRGHSRRALGRGGTAGTDGGAQHAGHARAIRRRFRSSGASTMTFRSTMSAMPRSGTKSPSKAISRARTASCVCGAPDARSRSPRCSGISRTSRPRSAWRGRRARARPDKA